MLAERSRTTIPFESDGTRRRSFAVGVADDTRDGDDRGDQQQRQHGTGDAPCGGPGGVRPRRRRPGDPVAHRAASTWSARVEILRAGSGCRLGPGELGGARARSASPARASVRASRSSARRRSSGGRPTASRTRASARSSGSATWRRARRRSSGARSASGHQHESRGRDVQRPADRRRGVGPVRRRDGCLAAEGGRRVRDLGLRDPRLDGRRRPAHGLSRRRRPGRVTAGSVTRRRPGPGEQTAARHCSRYVKRVTTWPPERSTERPLESTRNGPNEGSACAAAGAETVSCARTTSPRNAGCGASAVRAWMAGGRGAPARAARRRSTRAGCVRASSQPPHLQPPAIGPGGERLVDVERLLGVTGAPGRRRPGACARAGRRGAPRARAAGPRPRVGAAGPGSTAAARRVDVRHDDAGQHREALLERRILHDDRDDVPAEAAQAAPGGRPRAGPGSRRPRTRTSRRAARPRRPASRARVSARPCSGRRERRVADAPRAPAGARCGDGGSSRGRPLERLEPGRPAPGRRAALATIASTAALHRDRLVQERQRGVVQGHRRSPVDHEHHARRLLGDVLAHDELVLAAQR